MNRKRPKIARVAPGAAAIDETRVTQAIEALAPMLRDRDGGIDKAGQYLLREFYDDDPNLYASASKNHASLRALLLRCETLDLPVTKTFLANALRIAVVTRALPEHAAFRALPASHRVELLKLRDPKRIEQVAGDVDAMTVRQLRDAVRTLTIRTTGRTATPRVLGTVRRIRDSLRLEDTWDLAFYREDVLALTEAQRAELREALGRASDLLGRLRSLALARSP